MQALALNLPVLHYRWVIDCVASGKVLAWSRYQLPAGESSFLHGAIRSRCLLPYDASSAAARLEAVVCARNLLLKDASLLFVTGRKMDAKRRLFLFLVVALGVKKIELVVDQTEARGRMLSEAGCWDWVFLGGAVSDKAEKLFEELDCWIVDEEYVMQSLILGDLAE